MRRGRSQVVNPGHDAGVLDRNTHPQVGRPIELAGDPGQPRAPLGEDLIGVLRRVRNHLEDLADEAQWDPGVEQVTHGVDEHHPVSRPGVGQVQSVSVDG